MTHGELLYLLLILASFAGFAVVLAYQAMLQARAAREHIMPATASSQEPPHP